jgi:hypothetical protein
MDYLILLVILSLITVVYITSIRKKDTPTPAPLKSTKPAETSVPEDTSYTKPSVGIETTNKTCKRVGAPLCGTDDKFVFSGYNNYTTYATYYH